MATAQPEVSERSPSKFAQEYDRKVMGGHYGAGQLLFLLKKFKVIFLPNFENWC